MTKNLVLELNNSSYYAPLCRVEILRYLWSERRWNHPIIIITMSCEHFVSMCDINSSQTANIQVSIGYFFSWTKPTGFEVTFFWREKKQNSCGIVLNSCRTVLNSCRIALKSCRISSKSFRIIWKSCRIAWNSCRNSIFVIYCMTQILGEKLLSCSYFGAKLSKYCSHAEMIGKIWGH